MSSPKVKTLTRQFKYTATWLADVLTVTLPSAHYLTTGNLVNVLSANATHDYIQVPVTVTGANSFTIAALSNPYYALIGTVVINYFSTGNTGMNVMTFPRGSGNSGIVQSFVTGTGTAVYVVEASLDGIHWTTLATVTHTATSGDTQSLVVEPAWAYLGFSITSIGAATQLGILVSA